jgi:CHAT domain-containing protein
MSDLVTGNIVPKPDYTNPNAPASYAHPYYWAPFVLTGNWR